MGKTDGSVPTKRKLGPLSPTRRTLPGNPHILSTGGGTCSSSWATADVRLRVSVRKRWLEPRLLGWKDLESSHRRETWAQRREVTDSKVMQQSGAKQDKNLREAGSTTFRGSEHLSLPTWRPSGGSRACANIRAQGGSGLPHCGHLEPWWPCTIPPPSWNLSTYWLWREIPTALLGQTKAEILSKTS